ncbi:cytoskeletal protein CcmA (bactofilin family) [Sphaerotilus hippei]|uniref:Cytoskeletal protein CcmA (Bactofilin family) n=1 Tax=Sphaerotilus hippei TaxID=744406 RepID=A0A318H1R7_9BURK|nr:polymer-forming cytoskeletal protein [Sphaerotilus hippei]PXW97085.1 cytoskeletal protein CcmA (bactofilin family) [Sphaerotilus hippei]
MFNSKKQPSIRSLVGEGTVIQGTLRFGDGLRIDGEVQGDVVANVNDTSILVISEKAKVVGTVKAGHVIINGTVIGPVESNHLLELQPKALIRGDVRYESLEMHQGATIEGALTRLNSGGNAASAALEDKKSPKLLAVGNDK